MSRPKATAAALLAAVIAVGSASCAAVPTSGSPQQVRGGGAPAQGDVEPLPPPAPTAHWTRRDVVYGFLRASASYYAGDTAAVSGYFAPGVIRHWHPSGGVTVVKPPTPADFTLSRGSQTYRGHRVKTYQVTLHGQQVASLSATGQYGGSGGTSYSFELGRIHGRWLITSPPPQNTLVLINSDFKMVAVPRDLYFFASASGARASTKMPGAVAPLTLVPDPTYAPAPVIAQVTSLVKALFQDTQSWLAQATVTAFPPGTRLRSVRVIGSTAIVNLGGAALRTSRARQRAMAVQLVSTLTSSSLSQPVIQSVQLEVGGRAVTVKGQTSLLPDTFPASLLPSASASTAYFIDVAGAVSELSHGRVRTAPSPASLSEVQPYLLAVSRSRRNFAVAGTGTGCVVYYGPLTASGHLDRVVITPARKTRCNSLTWDNRGALWVSAGSGLWVVRHGHKPVAVSGLPGKILSMRFAPDGVRLAMVLQASGSREVELAAVSRASGGFSLAVPDFPLSVNSPSLSALGWHDADNLIVAAQSLLHLVPENGATSRPFEDALPAGTRSVATAGANVVVGLANGQLEMPTGPGGSWQPVPNAVGYSPVFPG